ncbi:MAG: hypothetical protein CSA32_01740 [Desulfobulbus propionicus]|nr:MAG: hypothetical protein CSA32_01740 [Desulfobulbus propionicus]
MQQDDKHGGDVSTKQKTFLFSREGYVPIVFDRYHIMAIINRQIDALRREQQNKLTAVGKHTLKGSRYLLLRNYHSLSNSLTDYLKGSIAKSKQ